MSFSSFCEFCFIDSMDSKRLTKSGTLSLENKIVTWNHFWWIWCLLLDIYNVKDKDPCVGGRITEPRVSCLLTSTKIVRTDLWYIARSWVIPFKLECRFFITICFTFFILLSVKGVEGQPERGKSLTTFWPSLNALYHSCARILDKADSP